MKSYRGGAGNTHWEELFAFSQLTDVQRIGLRKKANIKGCYGVVIVLFVEYKRAFIINIKDITDDTPEANLTTKSINIKKIDKWTIPYFEIETIPSRKQILEYTGEFPDLGGIDENIS